MQCPHCLKHFHETWQHNTLMKDAYGTWGAAVTSCPACQRAIITIGKMLQVTDGAGRISFLPALKDYQLAHPRSIARSPIPPEVPEEFAADYREACLVFADSPKASAALSRRCLQHLLREKVGVKKDDLAKEIQQVLDVKQLPAHISRRPRRNPPHREFCRPSSQEHAHRRNR
jgi:Domain of unknown function (DUF4145)